MIELLGLLYAIAKDAWNAVIGQKRRLTPEQKIELRQKWKPLFEEEIYRNWRGKLRQDIIIRDVRRVDSYPDIDDAARGISPWFRLGLIDLYNRGILVALRWERLIQEPDGTWREREYDGDSEEGEKAVLAGQIPFENIEAVDWDGDDYYYFPHIYCHFTIKKEPYESIGYYREIEDIVTRPRYSELVSFKNVRRRQGKRKSWWKRSSWTKSSGT
jgi:hypothetical protein